MLPLLTVSLQSEFSLLIQFDFKKLPDFLSCGNICTDAQFSGQFCPPGWGLRLHVLTAFAPLSPVLLPHGLRAASLCTRGRNSHPLPCTWLLPSLLMKETGLKRRRIKDTQFFMSYTKESLSDRSIKLLDKQAPTQAAVRDLSSFSPGPSLVYTKLFHLVTTEAASYNASLQYICTIRV